MFNCCEVYLCCSLDYISLILPHLNHEQLATTSTSRTHTQGLISLEDQLKSSEYLLDDTCVLGVEILQIDVCRSLKKKNVKVQKKFLFLQKKFVSVQNLFLQKKDFTKGDYTWTMNNFPELDLKPSVLSPAFEIGRRKWYASVLVTILLMFICYRSFLCAICSLSQIRFLISCWPETLSCSWQLTSVVDSIRKR